MRSGHVFVVHSKMESVQFDAALVPTGPALSVRRYWGPVLNHFDLRDSTHLDVTDLRPDQWPAPFARVPTSRGKGPEKPTWFIDVARHGAPSTAVEHLMATLEGALAEIARTVSSSGKGRTLPLLAMNTLGVGGGGFDSVRGHVIDRLLQTCQSFVDGHGIDIVIVADRHADYTALQYQRRKLAEFPSLSAALQRKGQVLAQLARQGDLALFVGAGVSIPAGLPDWGSLLDRLAEASGLAPNALSSLDSALDKAELIGKRLGGPGALKRAISDAMGEVTTPGMSHVQLAALDCREAITTNYDSLYEGAVNATHPDDPISVLPFQQRKPFERWILKMHGDLRHEGRVILSRSDFVGYTSTYGPVGAIVQALLLTKHLLVVGTSLTDDNFLRLAYEVTNYLQAQPTQLDDPVQAGDGPSSRAPLGTVLNLRRDAIRESLWDGTFDVVGVSDSDLVDEQARNLSIMLDFIAMHAAPEAHLLDVRYESLLEHDELDAARAGRALALALDEHAAAHTPSRVGWQVLRQALNDLGGGAQPGRTTSPRNDLPSPRSVRTHRPDEGGQAAGRGQ